MSTLSDRAVEHLRQVADWPDLAGTRYEAQGLIGRGGMGSVYAARDSALGREVALKVLSAPLAGPEGAARVLREARIIAGLEHPGIIPIHDVGTLSDGRVFYTMKLVRGTRLDAWAEGNRSLAERLRTLECIAEAVAFAHAHDVVHRDLKPANVMVGAFGEVLVMDWGVAKVLGSPRAGDRAADASVPASSPRPYGDVVTSPGAVLGTHGFMAPEQAAGGEVDARADVFGLGMLLGTLLPAGVAIPKRLEAIRRMATAPLPESRYADAAGFAEDLRRFAAGERVLAYPEGMLARLERLAARYRVAILLVLAYLVMRLLLLALGGP